MSLTNFQLHSLAALKSSAAWYVLLLTWRKLLWKQVSTGWTHYYAWSSSSLSFCWSPWRGFWPLLQHLVICMANSSNIWKVAIAFHEVGLLDKWLTSFNGCCRLNSQITLSMHIIETGPPFIWQELAKYFSKIFLFLLTFIWQALQTSLYPYWQPSIHPEILLPVCLWADILSTAIDPRPLSFFLFTMYMCWIDLEHLAILYFWAKPNSVAFESLLCHFPTKSPIYCLSPPRFFWKPILVFALLIHWENSWS